MKDRRPCRAGRVSTHACVELYMQPRRMLFEEGEEREESGFQMEKPEACGVVEVRVVVPVLGTGCG